MDEACRVAKDRSGETAAEEWAEQLFNEKYDACERVASKRALTMRGLLAKLAFIAGDFDADEELSAEMGTSEKILFSVAVDFKALQAAGHERRRQRTTPAGLWRLLVRIGIADCCFGSAGVAE